MNTKKGEGTNNLWIALKQHTIATLLGNNEHNDFGADQMVVVAAPPAFQPKDQFGDNKIEIAVDEEKNIFNNEFERTEDPTQHTSLKKFENNVEKTISTTPFINSIDATNLALHPSHLELLKKNLPNAILYKFNNFSPTHQTTQPPPQTHQGIELTPIVEPIIHTPKLPLSLSQQFTFSSASSSHEPFPSQHFFQNTSVSDPTSHSLILSNTKATLPQSSLCAHSHSLLSSSSDHNSLVQQLLPHARLFSFTWFHLQASKRKHFKNYNKPMSQEQELSIRKLYEVLLPLIFHPSSSHPPLHLH